MLPPASSQTTHTLKTFGIHLILHFVQYRSEFSLGPSHDLYPLALVQMLTLKILWLVSPENIEIRVC